MVNEFFSESPKFCDMTSEVVDEEGLIRFYRCTREPGHSGAWHVGWEFGPNLDLSENAIAARKAQMWPVGSQPQSAQDNR